MTDINTRGKLPFTIVSSSVNTGYAAELTAAVGQNIDLVNHHRDEYGQLENSPLQGPFTQQHIGGNQHRHTNLNSGNDNSNNRAEGYFISASQGSVKIYGPDVKGASKPRATLTRDFTAKSPVNIKNIQTSGNIAGNFEYNYQVVQNVGRRLNNNLIADGFEAGGVLTTKFVNKLLPILNDNLSSYSNNNTFTSNANFLGDGTSRIRTETSTSKKYFRLNTSSGDRFLKLKNPLKQNDVFSFSAIVNRDSVDYDTGSANALNLDAPENGEDLLLQYSYDNVNWITYKTVLTGSTTYSAEQIRITDTILLNIEGQFYLRLSQIIHDGSGTDNYGISDIIVYSAQEGYSSYSLPDITRTDASGIEYKDKTTFVQRFNAPGGKEESSRGSLDREGEDYSPNNSLVTRNIKVKQPFYKQLAQHAIQFNSNSTIHEVNRNTLNKVELSGNAVISGTRYDNFWVQHSIPATDLRYKWIADSVSSSQQPIEYQSYNLPYSTSSSYNLNGAYDDLEFELKGPFGDHLGISGAIDKGEMFVSTYTNTMYRDRKYFEFNETNTYIDLSSVSSDITEKDFTISFWMKSNENLNYDLSKAKEESNYKTSTDDSQPEGIFFKPDGSKVYVVGNENNKIYEYKLDVPWQVGSANLSTEKDISADTTQPTGIYFKPDGLKLYITDQFSKKIIEYTLTTSWDITSAGSSVKHPFTQDLFPSDLFFKPDGTKIYVLGENNNEIYEKILSTAWDLTTTGSAVSYTLTGVTQPRALTISENGKRLVVFDDGSDSIYYYTFNTSWQLNSGLKIILSYSRDVGVIENQGTALFISENQKKLYYIGKASGKIHQLDFNYEPLPLLQYSGSSSDNYLLLDVSPSSSNVILSGSGVSNSIKSNPIINDDKWHLITLVSDKKSLPTRISDISGLPRSSTSTKIYVDGGLATQATQLYKTIDLNGVFLSSKNISNVGRKGYNLHDIMIWDSVLTEKQINEVYKITKSSYGQLPKKYFEHKLDSSIIPAPIHIYSTRINKQSLTLIDEVGNKNGTFVNFTPSINLQPQNNGIISYSTYFNGPYQGASWKSIRNNEHPVTRKLTTENTNIVSVVIPEGSTGVIRTIRGTQVRFTLPGSRKQGTILNVKESPVYLNNKPLKHKFVLKDSSDQNVGFELTHTYGNNLQYFANQQLNDTLGLGKKERQIYDTLLEYYDGTVEENENPIERLIGYTYNETIIPKQGQGLLKQIRQRTDYVTDQPGYGIDGYDRQLGTQRAFWRDNQEDRMRTVNSYINSIGNSFDSIYLDLPFQTPSMAALEFITESRSIEYIEPVPASSGFKWSYMDTAYKNGAELNQQLFNTYVQLKRTSFRNYNFRTIPASQIPELYFSKSFDNFSVNYNPVLKNGNYPNTSLTDPVSLRASPKYIYEHGCDVYDANNNANFSTLPATIRQKFTHDLGLNRITEKISGKNSWYDSYDDYYVDVKNLSNDNLKTYSTLPEFKISDNIKNLINSYAGDVTKIILDNYDTVSISKNKEDIYKQNEDFVYQDTIKIIVGGVKKLLPYNGFYPQDRSIQLINYLKESYLNTNIIRGGILTGSGLVPYYNDKDLLVKFYKETAFLEPLFAPGIFYNLIKSGIAVSWSVYTGSLPSTAVQYYTYGKPPDYRINFETILDLKDISVSSSVDTAGETRILKFKDFTNTYSEEYKSQGFFERISRGSSKLYSLSMHNFLAETVNFFLKDSKLNSFISKPETEFSVFESSKTYYMNVVLRNKDIIMCEAHSSSISDNFGKMKGRYFGPSFWSGSVDEETDILNNRDFYKTKRDPAYCMFTPPYYYGDSVARLSFKPPDDGKYTLDEILSNIKIDNLNTSFIDNTVYDSGSLYSSLVMPIESSINLKGKIEERQQTSDISLQSNIVNNLRNVLSSQNVGTVTNNTGIKKWVISSKMETPVLDFINQDFVTSSNLLSQSYIDNYIKTSINSSHTPPTSSGFGRGMWSGYGEIPTADKGIFVELRESFPRELIGKYNLVTRTFKETNTGSLLQACGFQEVNSELSKKVGELADSREISEAIIIIPYSENTRNNQNILYYRGEDPQSLFGNGTVSIEGHNFFTIDENMFNHQKSNILASKPAVDKKYFLDIDGNVVDTSISRMIKLMSKYVIPPNFDFLLNRSIKPFVMYISEFTSTLDKNDLADIWQGVMPKIAMRAEREEQVISHKNSIFDFFHGQGLPKDVKFMIFKAKKRAQINYYKMTADSTDDGLFPSIQTGKPPLPYSFNWPYDYCSLVETAKVDIQIEYLSGSNNI